MRLRWLAIFIFGSLPLQASVVPWMTEDSPAVSWKAAEDDSGGFYLLWTRPAEHGARLLGQHLTADGAALWTVPGASLLPVIADTSSWTAFADSAHGLGIAWVDEGKVRVQRWTPEGEPFWKAPLTVSDVRFAASAPAGVADGGGGFFVVWAEKAYANRSVLMAQHLNAQGAALWPVAVRVALRPSDQRQPAVAFDGAAGLIVAWADYLEVASDWRVQRLNYQGFRAWGLEGISVSSPAGTGSASVRIAPWGQGSLTMAWAEGSQGRSRVHEAQINPRGVPLPDRALPAPATGDQWNPVLTGSGDGQYWVGWEDNRNERNWQVYVRTGTTDLPLAPSVGDQGRLALAEDDAHGVFAAWLDNRKSLPALYAQHLGSTGQPLWEAAGREVSAAVPRPDTPVLLVLGSGRVALVWANHPTKKQSSLSWQIL